MRELPFVGTHKADRFNSTDFTNCCGLAVLRDDSACPSCRRPVIRLGVPDNGRCRMCDKPRIQCHC